MEKRIKSYTLVNIRITVLHSKLGVVFVTLVYILQRMVRKKSQIHFTKELQKQLLKMLLVIFGESPVNENRVTLRDIANTNKLKATNLSFRKTHHVKK